MRGDPEAGAIALIALMILAALGIAMFRYNACMATYDDANYCSLIACSESRSYHYYPPPPERPWPR